MNNINNYDYRLFFGKNIKDPRKELIEIPPLHAKQNFYIEINKVKYSIALSGLKFTRKVYEPGIIEAEVSIVSVVSTDTTEKKVGKVPTFGEVEDLLMDRQIELTIVDIDKFKAKNEKQGTGDDKGVTVDEECEKSIAKNYYVYMINPQIATNSGVKEMFVKLTIHSFDKLMDIDKYCKAYTAKKLAKDIITKELDTFGLPASLVSTEVNNLQNLKYENGEKTTEKIQPYLVQYNETFLDFLVRTANRCGEFLFFEDGKLTLGLPTKTPAELSGFDSVTMQGYTDGIVEVEDYSRDSVKDNGIIAGELNFDPIAKDDSGLPNDAFTGKLNYNTPLAGEEYIFPLENDKYTNLNRELCFRGRDFEQLKTIALKATAAITACEDGNAIKMIGDAVTQTATDSMNAGIIMNQADEKTKDNLKKAFGDNKEQYNNGRLVAFSSLDEKGWIGHKFYSAIRKLEEQQHQKIICIDMGTTYAPVSLGDKIQVDGLEGHYIVVQIRQIANLVWNRNYRMFNPSDPSTDLYSDRQSQVIYAIPVIHPLKDDKKTLDLTKETFVPPVAPVPMFRKASPQTAFVVDNSDDKYQGRVRIAYPWQSPNDEKRKAVLVAEDSLRKAQETFDAYKKKANYLTAQIILFEGYIKPELDKLKKMSEDDRKKYCAKQQEKINDEKEEIRKLEELLTVLPESITKEDFEELSLEKYQEFEAKKTELRQKIEDLKKNVEIEQLSLQYIQEAGNDPDKALEALDKDKKNVENDRKKLETAIEKAQGAVDSAKKDVDDKVADWDKEVKKSASPWVRVATPMATQGGGVYFTPNKGDEVLVNYDCDNVERPYVVGSVYSKNTLAPGESVDKYTKNYLQKKASMMLMSPNGQHISFNAPKDGWKFVHGFSPALKTLQLYFPDLKGKDLEWGDGKDLAGGIYMGDRFGLYELSLSSHDRKIKINSPYGNVEIGAFTGISIKAPNGDIKISGKNVTIEAGNKLTLHSGKNIKDERKMIDLAKDALSGVATKAISNTVGNLVGLKVIDMSMVRSVLEVFFRPIDGTLNLKSNNFVMLEAGKGKVEVPLDRYAPRYQNAHKIEHDQDRRKVFGKIGAYITHIDDRMKAFSAEYVAAKELAYQKKAAYEKAFSLCWREGAYPDVVTPSWALANGEALNENTLDEKINEITAGKMRDNAGPWRVPGQADFNDIDALRLYIKPLANDYGRAVADLHAKAKAITTLLKNADVTAINQAVVNVDADANTSWIDEEFKKLYTGENPKTQLSLTIWTNRYGGNNPTANFLSADDRNSSEDPFINSMLFRRRMLAHFLLMLRNDQGNSTGDGANIQHNKYFDLCYDENTLTDNYLKNSWINVAWLEGDAPGKKDRFWDSALDMFNAASKILSDNLGIKKPISQFIDPNEPKFGWAHKVWNDRSGQILFSNKKGYTYTFKGTAIERVDPTAWCSKYSLRSILKGVK